MSLEFKEITTSYNHRLLVSVFLYLIGINYFNEYLSNDNVKFLLTPIQAIVTSSTGVGFNYNSVYGYIQTDGLIRINKSCSGFIFLNVLLSIGLITLFQNNSFKNSLQKVFLMGGFTFGLAYITCLISNSSRIILGIKMQMFSIDNSWFPNHFLHDTIGIIYFLMFSVLFYLLLQKTFQSWNT